MPLPQPGDQRAETAQERIGIDAEVKPPGDAAAELAREACELHRRAQHAFGALGQPAARLRELETTVRAREQLDLQEGLQRADMGAGRRLADVQALRRPREMALLSDRDERPQLGQVHGTPGHIVESDFRNSKLELDSLGGPP
jgi:hypothetical protein